MQLTPELQQKLKLLPEQPGVYRFLNTKGTILYIGKAKSLKKRVNSYFIGIQKHSYRIQHLVENIHDVEYTVVNTEIEALMLENNLIKHHQPKYNILLKDGKTYPYIIITNERFPRIYSTRNKQDNGQYFGPYVNPGAMYTILELIHGYIKLRNCTYNLSEENIQSGKFRVCLEYQVGNCGAPCVGKVEEESYNEGIAHVRHILKGNLAPVLDNLEEKMLKAAEVYEFEKAELYRRKMEQVVAYRKKNTIVSGKVEDVEVLTVAAEAHIAIVNHFRVHNGTIIATHTYEHKRENEEELSEILVAAMAQVMADTTEPMYNDILTNVNIEEETLQQYFSFTVPKIGDKKHLVDLSLKNCLTLINEKLYTQNFKTKKTPNEVMMEELQKALHLKELPTHIECFDNSNFQGTNAVSACVVFKEGKPAKRDYRHFNVKTVEGPNDFATMEEVVERRYKRLLEEKQPLPKLILIDGGKGQLSAAAKALERLQLIDKIPMVGIAKRLEEIYSLNDPFPLYIDKKSPALILIQRCRDEAHRFGITFHRNQRSNAPRQRTHLTELEGIGEATAKVLLQHFKSVKKIKAATETEIATVIGKHKAALIVKAIAEGAI